MNALIKILFLIIFAISHNGFAQTSFEACKERVKSVYAKFNEVNKSLGVGRQIYYHYTTRIFLTDSVKNPPTRSEVKVTIGKNKIEMRSAQAEFYQDQYDAFSVLPEKKMIFWADSKVDHDKNILQNTIVKLQDSLFSTSIVRACQLIGRWEKIVLESKLAQKKSDYNMIEFWIDHEKSTLGKMVIYYPTSASVRLIEYVFHEIDFHHHQTDFEVSARQKIFSRAALSERFAGYRVIDSRISKKNAK